MSGEGTVLRDGKAETSTTRIYTGRVDADVSLSFRYVLPKRCLNFVRRSTFGLSCRRLTIPEPHTLRVTRYAVKRVQRHVSPLENKSEQLNFASEYLWRYIIDYKIITLTIHSSVSSELSSSSSSASLSLDGAVWVCMALLSRFAQSVSTSSNSFSLSSVSIQLND